MIGPLGIWEIALILIIALIVFGPGKLPEVGKAVGKGLREFKSAANSITSDDGDKDKDKVTIQAKEEKEIKETKENQDKPS